MASGNYKDQINQLSQRLNSEKTKLYFYLVLCEKHSEIVSYSNQQKQIEKDNLKNEPFTKKPLSPRRDLKVDTAKESSRGNGKSGGNTQKDEKSEPKSPVQINPVKIATKETLKTSKIQNIEKSKEGPKIKTLNIDETAVKNQNSKKK